MITHPADQGSNASKEQRQRDDRESDGATQIPMRLARFWRLCASASRSTASSSRRTPSSPGRRKRRRSLYLAEQLRDLADESPPTLTAPSAAASSRTPRAELASIQSLTTGSDPIHVQLGI